MDTVALTALVTQLGELALKNTATAVHARVKAARAGKQHEQQVNELTELINELVDERNELISIAHSFEQELAAQQISSDDIAYINDTLIPAVEYFMSASGNDDSDAKKNLENMKAILSVEILTVMQLIGFNYKQAIGEPLTAIIQRLILSQVPQPEHQAEMTELRLQHQNLLLELSKDSRAIERYKKIERL